MEQKRSATRKRVLKGAKAVYGGYTFVVDCTLRDISEDGARLRVPASVTLPETFLLYMPDAQTIRSAQVLWRKAGELGIRYESEARDVRNSGDPRERRLIGMAMV